ncbi:protein kinase family protein / peptidoglycan-binding LysM domain-containing protein [Euphorbia peplus]|nr:protein kinase family protein / peptidoglycan-binding LysM domain-containing protein [Euphorbia peplus]
MLFPWFVILVLTCFNLTRSDPQFYDPSECESDSSYPGSRYTCKSHHKSCSTFLVYRANQKFNSISTISHLFQSDFDELLRVNNLSPSSSDILVPGREVLVPVVCSCIDNFFQANFSYMVPANTTLSDVACDVFEGLVKFSTLLMTNPSQENGTKVGTEIYLPLRCACPDNFSNNDEIMYLITYPLVEGDGLNLLSKKFGVSPMDIWTANQFEPFPTVYPNTTILIPLKNHPIIDFVIPDSPPPVPGFLPTATVEHSSVIKLKKLYILVSVIGFFLIVTALGLCLWYAKTFYKRKIHTLLSFNTRSSPLSCSTLRSSPKSGNSCLSPDLLVGVKYSLKHYSMEELGRATDDFSDANKIGDTAHKASIDNTDMMIKQMRFDDTRKTIDVHTKINHINIVNLVGACYGDTDLSCSYLIFELPSNGCLRKWLSDSASSLPWHRRIQIAFDIATALHYLHYCIFPSYAHMNVNSRNIFVTEKWRAKLTNIRTDISVGESSERADIFEYGIVLLELISGREDKKDGKMLKDCIGFLGGDDSDQSEGSCFEKLRSFMDPSLKEDYPLAEALCLAVLAKACVEDDPLHRPSMDDVHKVIVRLV